MTSSSGTHSSVPFRFLHLNPLFWVMFAVVILPFLAFLVTSYLQLYSTLSDINTVLDAQVQVVLDDDKLFTDDSTLSTSLAKARVALERDVVLLRDERASAALATRTWMRFMSLIFGTSLVVTGAVFVLGRVATPRTDSSLQWSDAKLELASRSPGIFLVFFGCCLIAIPNLSTQTIGVDDTSTYIQRSAHVATIQEPTLADVQLSSEELEELKRKED